MPNSHSLTIGNQTLQPNTPTAVTVLTWTAVNPVNVLAGQNLTAGTINTDAPPTSYPQTGNDQVDVWVNDEAGNLFPVVVTYTGVSGNSFTGCTAQNPDPTFVTTLAQATPNYTGSVSINRTGAGNHPWLNNLTSADTLVASVQWSTDGGTTWNEIANSGDWTGGAQNDHLGNPLTVNTLSASGLPPAANAARVVLTASTATFINGTITVRSL